MKYWIRKKDLLKHALPDIGGEPLNDEHWLQVEVVEPVPREIWVNNGAIVNKPMPGYAHFKEVLL